MKEKLKDFIKNHKLQTIIISVVLLLIIFAIVVAIVILNLNNQNIEETANDEIIEEMAEDNTDEEQDVLLEVDTNGLEEGEEVAIIENEDGTIKVVAKNDPKFNEITEGKSYEIGKITDNGISIKTKDSNLISISSKDTETQKANVTVINNATEDTKEEASSNENATDDTTHDNPDTNISTASNSNSNTETPSKPTSSVSTNNGATSSTKTPSKPADTTSSIGTSSKPASSSSSTSTSSSSNAGAGTTSSATTPSTPKHTPFSEAYRKENTAAASQVVSWINANIKKDPDYATWGGKAVVSHTKRGNYFSYVPGYFSNMGTAGGTYYIYAEDIYWYGSDGITVYKADTAVYVYET